MARFYVNIEGNRGAASRMGNAASGVMAHARGWNIGGRVDMGDRDGSDVMTFLLTGGSHGPNIDRTVWVEAQRKNGRVKLSILVDGKKLVLPRPRKQKKEQRAC